MELTQKRIAGGFSVSIHRSSAHQAGALVSVKDFSRSGALDGLEAVLEHTRQPQMTAEEVAESLALVRAAGERQ